jgi:hypothetical protein
VITPPNQYLIGDTETRSHDQPTTT